MVDQTTYVWKVYVNGQPAELLDARVTGYPLVAEAFASPGLQWLAYEQQLPPYGVTLALHIAQLGGGTDVVVTEGELQFDGWSPDSAYYIYHADRVGDLLLGAPGSGPGLANYGRGTQITWVDAQRFLYVYYTGTLCELRLANVDGTWPPLSALSGRVEYAASNP